MKSDLPKVLHPVCGRPMLAYVLDACRDAGVSRLIVVVGHGKEDVISAFSDEPDITWVEQTEQHGTGHAARVSESAVGKFDGQVLVIAGDMPLVRAATLKTLLEAAQSSGHAVTLATAALPDPAGYGRIVRDADGNLAAIVEHRDCTPEQLQINEVNISYYCYDGGRMFQLLHELDCNNAKREYYITDTIRFARELGWGAGAVAAVPPEDAMGVNSRADLALISRVMQQRIQAHWMEAGVTLVDPATTWIESGADIGRETVIQPFCFIERGASIGGHCRIGPFAHVPGDASVADGSSFSPNAWPSAAIGEA